MDFYSASSLKQQFADRHIAPHGHILLDQPLLSLFNAACSAEKQQPDQGEKLVPNTFIIFVFLFTGLNPVHIHTPTCFQGPDDC